MADWYCDPSLVQAGYLDYASTPTAAGTVPTKPEDGDGKSIGVAVMATFVVNFSGIPAADGAVTIAGVAFTAKASGATGNQFNAVTDATTCATNLKNAINASTTNAVKPVGVIAATAPLRNIVNATSSGGVLTVYTRICGADWNSVVETSTLTNAALTQWSGGSSGAWGYLFNLAAIAFPTSVAAFAYGAWSGTYLGLPAAGDICHIRTRRSAVDITLALPDAVITCITRNAGTRSAPFTYLADNGIKWSGDAGVLTISMAGTNGAGQRYFFTNGTGGCYQILSGVRLTETTCNWRWLVTGTASTNVYVFFGIGHTATALDCPVKIVGMEFDCGNNTNATAAYIGFRQDCSYVLNTPRLHLQDVVYKSKGMYSPFDSGNSNQTYIKLENCLFDHTGLTSVTSSAILGASTPYGCRFEAEGCEWRGFPAVANQSGFQNYSGVGIGVILRDCKYTNIKVQGAIVGATEVNGLEYVRSISVSSSLSNRNYIFENDRKSFAWIDSAAPKTSSSILPDGATTFSVRTAVTSTANTVTPLRPVAFPRLAKHNTLASGTRTATLKILVDANINTALGRAPKTDEMWVEVSYVGTDGLAKKVSSRPMLGAVGSTITAGTGSDWSATAYDVNGVSHSYNAYELSVSVPSVQTLTEIGLVYVQGCQSSSVDNLVFLDPEWALV